MAPDTQTVTETVSNTGQAFNTLLTIGALAVGAFAISRVLGNLESLGFTASDAQSAADAVESASDRFESITAVDRVDTGAGPVADRAATYNEWLNPAVPVGVTEPALDRGDDALQDSADAGFDIGLGLPGTDEQAAREGANEALDNVPGGNYLRGYV